MPLREFGARAAAGALGLQHGNTTTSPFGTILVNFPIPFGAVPDVFAIVLDGINNYTVTIRQVNALWFSAHVRQLTGAGDIAAGADIVVMWMAVE